ncbi:MAG: ATP phosphoribosyltransferase [Methanobacteriaceae archaeon]|uniref:ATP phosphoribosyltransferase n=1 Tax=Methanobrevibacter acididurans TaxID=120963 RepID=UPI0037636AF2|nr:ATP phosphoribosyltransferase [Methanobacteriaceae archaeon]MDD4593671.1 ATP phosphoribosyltransferase [Methanobacteriaceae archaeon]
MKLIIAVPSKGRISNPSVEMIEQAGLGLKDSSNRKLFSSTYNENIDIMFARAADIPEFVAEGIVDMGITGLDLIKESNADVEILTDLNFGQTSLVLASPENSKIKSEKDLKDGMAIATEFPNLTKKYLDSKNLKKIKIVKLTGSTEIAPFIGIADAITDLTSTGTTLTMNHLKIVDTLLKSSIKLITNKNIYNNDKNKKILIDEVKTSICGVINAKQKKLIMMNVASADLNNVKDVMPAMTGPTISEVLSKIDTVAVQAVVDEDEVFELINKLRKAGAHDILVVPIERII